MGRTNAGHLNSVGPTVLLAAIVAFLIAFFTQEAFFEWAFERHQNTWSWVARPLLILPYAYFAWRRSLNGVLLTILAILTSMFWFPAPETVDPQVAGFLAMEKERLLAGFDQQNLIAIALILIYGWALAAAFWMRSVLLGAAVAVSGALGKALGLNWGGDLPRFEPWSHFEMPGEK